mmetsp:Transcript_47041/g.71118  ORF Transcript_47041/g.71118 Transcript_47041/m.71118 type:complete len:629 (+) Transcript_47041:78-1964(+)
MHLTAASSAATFLSIISATWHLHPVDSATYQLSYDGWFHSSNLDNDLYDSDAGGGRSNDIVKDISSKLTSHFVSQWEDYTINSNKSGEEKEDDNTATVVDPPICTGTRCFTDVSRPQLSFTIHANTIQHLENNDDDHLLRLDVIMTSAHEEDSHSNIFARDALVNAVTTVLSHPEATMQPTWLITERPFPSKVGDNLLDASSIESIILSSPNIHAKKRIYSNSSAAVEIWSYHQTTSEASPETRSLFIDSKLRTTTSATAVAHAEAFIHPALLSHTHPKNVAVFSDTPLLLLKEILKYKSVERITLIDVDLEALDAALKYMPDLNDCSAIRTETASCLDSAQVEIIKGGLDTWLENLDAEHEEDYDYDMYDILFMDVASASQKEQYLSELYHKDHFDYLIDAESMIVVNVGSMPSIHGDDVTDQDSRTDFFKMISTDSSCYGSAIVYEEPLAAPLDTTFISIFSEFHSDTYFRYVRPMPTSIDLDIVQRFHKQDSSLLPTQFYDGSSHKAYLTPSRAWENWYCRSNLGKDQYQCHTLLPKFYDPANHVSETEIRRDATKGRGHYAVTDIPEGSFINADDSHIHLHMHRYQWEALNDFVEKFPDAQMYRDLKNFFESYGYENEPNGLSG